MTCIGRNIRRLRAANQLTMAQVSRRSGVSHSYLCEIENSTRVPSVEVLEKISECLGVTVDCLFQRIHFDGGPLPALVPRGTLCVLVKMPYLPPPKVAVGDLFKWESKNNDDTPCLSTARGKLVFLPKCCLRLAVAHEKH